MKNIILLAFLYSSAFLNQSFGQSIKKEEDKINGETFVYYSMQPVVKVRGILILLPSYGEKPQSIFNKTSLPKLLAEKGYLTIAPRINNTLFADQYTIAELDQIIKKQSEKYAVSSFIIGGLSSGGAIAVGYAEYLLAKDTANNMLKGVFSIDAPLDLSRIYASAERKINYSCGGLIKKEGSSTKNSLEHILGGSPATKPEQYLKYSSYSASASDGGNAKFLKNIPVRLYSEPDLEFVRRTYCEDLQYGDINAFDLESLSKFLLKIGNNKSKYITTTSKGFHSWNIVEPVDCMNWVLSIVN